MAKARVEEALVSTHRVAESLGVGKRLRMRELEPQKAAKAWFVSILALIVSQVWA